jgi:hypothetical protein
MFHLERHSLAEAQRRREKFERHRIISKLPRNAGLDAVASVVMGRAREEK